MSYRLLFLADAEPQPWPCWRCKKPVYLEDMVVHHVDEDRANNAPGNLVPMHGGCHTAHHSTGRTHSSETREKLRAARSRQVFTPEHRARQSEGQRGRVHSAETRAKISAAKQGVPHPQCRVQCPCGRESTGAGLAAHQRSTGHEGRL